MDRDFHIWKIARKKPSPRRQQEENFCELFRLAEIQRGIEDRNNAYYREHNEDGAGI